MAKAIAPNLSRNKIEIDNTRTILIVCEGAKTEIDYFEKLKNVLIDDLVGIKVIPVTSTSGPQALKIIESADAENKLLSDKLGKNADITYCVFDEDDAKNISPRTYENIKEAIKQADAKTYHIILTNPCIEYWFLLHYVEHNTAIEKQDDQSKGKVAENLLKQYIPDYEKNGVTNIADIFDKTKIQIAVTRAESTLKNHPGSNDSYQNKQKEYVIDNNPSTNMQELIYAMSKKFSVDSFREINKPIENRSLAI